MNAARWICLGLLARMPHGALTILERGRTVTVGAGEPHARVRINTERAWGALLHGSRGLADAYADGWWDADDLAAVIRVAARNAPVLDAWRRHAAPARVPLQALRGIRRANSRARNRRDIAAHYDLGDDLFGLMLDETLMYSSAYFPSPRTSLADASRAKLELVCEKLALGPGDHVLEIGTGWGGFAVHAAATRGCRITTTTISPAQYEHARQRVQRAALRDRVTVLRQDYRDVRGRYDKLISIEMVEAVGWRSFGTFFNRCGDLLAPDGVMLLQSIVIDDRAYEVEKASASFIRSHIFPGGSLPSVEVIARCLARDTDLRIADLHELTPHYAETLRRWRGNVERCEDQLHRLGYDKRFRRLWRLYLAYCEAGFDEGRLGVVQMLLGKPRWRPSISSAPARQLGDSPDGAPHPEQPAKPVGAVGDLLG